MCYPHTVYTDNRKNLSWTVQAGWQTALRDALKHGKKQDVESESEVTYKAPKCSAFNTRVLNTFHG